MLPTLWGRIQTRIFVLAVIGSLVQLVITPVLPGTGDATLGQVYRTTFAMLLAVGVLGVLWELIYHGLMQFRWEKDWPTLFGLLNGINEGVVLWLLIRADLVPGVRSDLSLSIFVVDFGIVWVVTWLWVNGPMRVFTVHWRFRGGRLI